MNFIRIFLYVQMFSFVLSCLPGPAPAQDAPAVPRYELAVSFDLAQHLMYGTAHITIPPREGMTIRLDGITATAIQIEKKAATPGSIATEDIAQINIQPDKDQQELYISYEKKVGEQSGNIIEDRGISLLQDWYPFPSREVLFTLSAGVPQGFIAFSESDHLPDPADEIARFSFSSPLRSLHFIAAPFLVDSLPVREDLQIYTYFLPKDRHLARDYLEAARRYIIRYEELVGPYPYNHFAIVENMRPTGYGMPTFTLLGQSVLRLPFIKDTSLGHEILHSWFGNSIEIDTETGNWGEGLTSYMADWLYREDKGEGAVNRKENILKYHSYATDQTAIPLKDFTSASHNQPMSKSVRATGYIRGAMLFHELRTYLGDADFHKGIRLFYSRYKGRTAGWADIETVFEAVTGSTLDSFFQQRLTRTDLPALGVADISVETTAEGPLLSFSLLQKGEAPFLFTISIEVSTEAGPQSFTRTFSAAEERVQLQLSSLPYAFAIDPGYDLLRRLDESERVAILSDFLGPRKAIVAVSGEDKKRISSFTEFFAGQNWEVKTTDELSGTELEGNNLILPGTSNAISRSLFGPLDHPSDGLTLESRIHPLNNSKSVLLLSFANEDELQRSLTRLPHYGKYSYLHFRGGRIHEKRFSPGIMGRLVTIADRPVAVPAAKVLSLEETTAALKGSRVIYIGETHTSAADHQLQYLVIAGIHRINSDIAIGLEMFPKSSQDALDRYISAEETMEEREFLKRSGYFKVWKFDYRYYKPIIDYARKHEIPLLGLNIDRNIVSSIFKEGSEQALNAEERELLPEERDLSLPGYYQRLQAVHGIHMTEGHGEGGLSGFIQAQAAWDEAMAENIAAYLTDNPEKQLIVLAGTQHARKDNGIPPRVQRRLDPIEQVVLLTEDSAGLVKPGMADYYFFLPEATLPPAGKMGISLEEKKQNGDTYLEVAELSAGSNATQSGLREGDRVEEVNGHPVKGMEDIRIAMVGMKPGDIADITIKRINGSGKRHEFQIKLYQPAAFNH